ncbi:MAG: Cell division inhibitor [Chthoniobacteraceae bacterium]|nr:Cell division inhibitor [Chthoniobacteraceae bacterium]
MNIGITGATGFIGHRLIDVALRRGHEVIAFSRNPEAPIPGCEMRVFSESKVPDISKCEALVHLAGEPVFGLWTPSKKRRIRESRVQGTRRIVEAINASATPPEVFVSGSAIGYYGESGERELTELSASSDGGFLSRVCHEWEAEAIKAISTRVVLLRTSIVLGKQSGALKMMAPIFRAGLGGKLGSGDQWMSWIHIEDEIRLILFAIENMDIAGPLNASAPWPVRNAEFTETLARTVHRPAFLHVPAFALLPLGEFRSELLDSKRVLPAVASDHQFGFQFPELGSALKHLLG